MQLFSHLLTLFSDKSLLRVPLLAQAGGQGQVPGAPQKSALRAAASTLVTALALLTGNIVQSVSFFLFYSCFHEKQEPLKTDIFGAKST